MNMGIGINDAASDEGALTGHQEPVACFVWFTAKGRILPKMLKYQEADGTLRTLGPIRVHAAERKNYCGIPTIRYTCSAQVEGKETAFTLLYYMERQEWKLLLAPEDDPGGGGY